MADTLEGTETLTNQDENDNAIFDNDTDLVEQSLLDKFTPKEPEEESEEEDVEATQDDEVEATEEETEEESEEEEAEESEEVAEPDDERIQAVIDKRLQRELKKFRKEQEAITDQLKEKLKEAETPATAIEQVKTTMNETVLDKIEDDAEKTIDFVEDNPDGVTINEGKDNERFMDRQELLAMKKNARQSIKEATKRRKVIQERVKNDEAIFKVYPTLSEKGSDDYLAIESVYDAIPSLKHDPKGLEYAIYLLKGRDAIAAQAEKPKKKKKEVKKAPKVPEAKPQPKKAAASTVKKTDLQDAIANGGDQDSLINSLTKRFS